MGYDVLPQDEILGFATVIREGKDEHLAHACDHGGSKYKPGKHMKTHNVIASLADWNTPRKEDEAK